MSYVPIPEHEEPVDLQETLIGGCISLAFFTLLHLFLPRIIKPKLKAPMSCQRTLHSIYSSITVVASIYLMYRRGIDGVWESDATRLEAHSLMFTLVFWAFDLFLKFFRFGFASTPVILHHVFSIRYAAFSCIEGHFGLAMVSGNLIAEVSNPIQHFTFLLRAYGYGDSALCKFLDKIWLPVYFLTRAVICPITIFTHKYWLLPADMFIGLVLFAVAGAKVSWSAYKAKDEKKDEWWKDFFHRMENQGRTEKA